MVRVDHCASIPVRVMVHGMDKLMAYITALPNSVCVMVRVTDKLTA